MSMVSAGDVVRLLVRSDSYLAGYDGLLVEVVSLTMTSSGYVHLECLPLSDRPDGGLRARFTWMPSPAEGRGFRRVEFPDLTDVEEVEAWLRTA